MHLITFSNLALQMKPIQNKYNPPLLLFFFWFPQNIAGKYFQKVGMKELHFLPLALIYTTIASLRHCLGRTYVYVLES